MKICWDTLEKFIYDKKCGCWKNKYGVKYIYMNSNRAAIPERCSGLGVIMENLW